MDLTGLMLLGRYRVEAALGAGGMGTVYRVWDTQRAAPLALKVLNADLADDLDLVHALETEARLLERLAHPHIVRFYGFYRDQPLAFLVEEYIDGPSLKQLIARRGGIPFSLVQVQGYLAALCPALHYAHSQGVIHCDLKPGNVLLDGKGNIYLADFGAARLAAGVHVHGSTGGTPAYMAPEQFQRRRVTPQTDVYALGVLLYEMVSGTRLFYGVPPEQRDELPPGALCRCNPLITPELEAMVRRCLEPAPERRYPGPMALLEAVSRLPSEPPVPPPPTPGPPTLGPLIPGTQPKTSWTPRRLPPAAVGMLMAAAAFILLILGYAVIGGGPRLSPEAGPRLAAPASATLTDTIPRPARTTLSPGGITTHPSSASPQPYAFEPNACMWMVWDAAHSVSECIFRIAVQSDGSSQVFIRWTAALQDNSDVKIEPEAVGSIFLQDDLGNRYDHFATGGAAQRPFILAGTQTAEGWYRFPPLDAHARTVVAVNGYYPDVQTPPIHWPRP